MTLEVITGFFMRGSFFFLLFIFTIYTLFLGYHWFTYGATYKTAMTALVVYLGGAALCFLVMGALLI